MVIGRWIAAAGVVGALAGCGSAPQGASEEEAATPSSVAVSSAPSVPSDPAADLDITIAEGQVSPVNAELDAQVGQPITLKVTSDTADELHVHAIPEQSFEIRPGASETFEFTVEVPGRVEVELHALHRTVVTIQVRP